jgi:hypothetical protein
MIVSSMAQSCYFIVGLVRRAQKTAILVQQYRGIGSAIGRVGKTRELR